MDSTESRRVFLTRLGALLTGAAGLSLDVITSADTHQRQPHASSAKGAPEKSNSIKDIGAAGAKTPYKISEWTGDNFIHGHQFRDGKLPGKFPDQPERTVDFVIAGGGIAGLTSAFYLKEHNVLLLDQYAEPGGQSRGGTFQGIGYSYGPAYVDTVEGIYGDLYSALGIKPHALKPDDNDFYWQKKWIHGTAGKDSNSLHAEFNKLFAANREMIKALPFEDSAEAMRRPDLAKLDGAPFASLLNGCSPEFIAFMNSVCKSEMCGNVQQVSALTGAYMLDDLQSVNYVFPGGNSAIAKALVAKLGKANSSALQSGTFVWKIQLNETGANVFYSTADGALHNVACRHVIVATPAMVAWRLIANLDDKQRANLMPFKYGSYLVANCLLDKQLLGGAYDKWLSPPFTFSDIVRAETPYELAGSYSAKMGSVLTLYHPWEPGSPGRALLMAGDRDAFAKSATNQLSELVEHMEQHLKEVVLTRWGHAIAVPVPGYFAKLQKIAAATTGSYSLAHSSTQGLQCAETAIRGARFASNRARAVSAKKSMLVPKPVS